MKAEIISSGTELLLGEITDTNTPYLARELAAIGINVYHHTTVGDNPARLLEAIQMAEKRAEMVIVSGGLGPTQDDITKEILADHLDVELVLDPVSFEKATKRYGTDRISKGNYRQALVLEGCTVLTNEIGMAAGIFIEKNAQYYILLPGPPNEFERMVTNHLLPILKELVAEGNILRSRNLNFFGLPEALVAEKLHHLIEHQSNPTIAVYAKEGVIDVRLTASAASEAACNRLLDELEEQIHSAIGGYFFGYNGTTIQDIIFDELRLKNQQLSLIEIQTSGEVLNAWTRQLAYQDVFKGGLYFSTHHAAEKHFNAVGQSKNRLTVNEEYVKALKDSFQTEYAVAVSSWGEIKAEFATLPEVLCISIIDDKGKITSKEVNFSRRIYFAEWVVNLKVSDFIRQVLLSLPTLEDDIF